MPNYYPRRIQPADSLLYDAQGNLVGLRSGTSGDEAIFGLSASELAATQALVSGAGNLIRTPSIPSSKSGVGFGSHGAV